MRPAIEVNGWTLLFHPVFDAVLSALERDVEHIEARGRDRTGPHPKVKLLGRMRDLMLIEIPADPAATRYALGNTLGPEHRHWRRAKFLGRFRLFFRYASGPKIIVYGWVNDENALRQTGGRSDPYAVFDGMLRSGRPPDDWDQLVAEARALENPS
jgi:toxin YhaV